MENDALCVRPRARDDVLFRQLDDDWVIFDPVSDRLHALNLTAALIWTECTGERDIDEITNRVATVFEPPQPRDRVLSDVLAAIARFREQGLLLDRH